MQSDSALVEARGLALERQDLRVFGPLDFRIGAGELVRIEGGNGAGKTSLLRILAGLLRPTSGSAMLHGLPVTRDRVAGEVVMLGHRLGLKGDLNAIENLRAAQRLYGCRRGTDVESVLVAVGLDGYQHELLRRLSAGQQKRVALARLWLLPAAIWLLDEPRVNLDAAGVAVVERLLERRVHGGGAALVTDHGGSGTRHAGRSIHLDQGPPS